jgi:hypothetical protein
LRAKSPFSLAHDSVWSHNCPILPLLLVSNAITDFWTPPQQPSWEFKENLEPENACSVGVILEFRRPVELIQTFGREMKARVLRVNCGYKARNRHKYGCSHYVIWHNHPPNVSVVIRSSNMFRASLSSILIFLVSLAAFTSASPLNRNGNTMIRPDSHQSKGSPVTRNSEFKRPIQARQSSLAAACAFKTDMPYTHVAVYIPGNLMSSAQVGRSIVSRFIVVHVDLNRAPEPGEVASSTTFAVKERQIFAIPSNGRLIQMRLEQDSSQHGMLKSAAPRVKLVQR